MRSAALLALFLPVTLAAAGPFAWKQIDGDRWQLSEAGQPVFVYNAGPRLANSAPADRERCCYVFPAYTPGGISPLDDFPKDHWHHHGLFWAWPDVEYDGKRYDLWMYKGIRHTPVSAANVTSTQTSAELRTANAWTAGERRIVTEDVSIVARPARGRSRELVFTLTWRALDKPVTLRGSQEKGKSYGGFSARFAEREGTVLRTDNGLLPKDDDLTAYAWAELEAAYQGKRATLRITPDPSNPHFPHQWCLRSYGFLGASFPGRTGEIEGFTLEPGKPLTLRFTVTLTDTAN